MGGVRDALSKRAASDGVGPQCNGLGPERMIEIQRARILSAMVEVSAELGAAHVTVAHIVDRAGVSRRTFYELYQDRDHCFLGAFDEAVARASRCVLDGYDPAAPWVVRVRSLLTGLLAFLEAQRGAGQLLLVGSLGAGAAALERRRRVIDQMLALVDEGGGEVRSAAELPVLMAEGIVGGVLSVLHARLIDGDREPLLPLVGPLMSMIVLPYLGPAAARRELARRQPEPLVRVAVAPADPLRDMRMRLTYRTVRVLSAVAGHPGSSNREIGLAAGMQDQGQISKLLTRLAKLGLIENSPAGLARGAPNAWALTAKGRDIERAVADGAVI